MNSQDKRIAAIEGVKNLAKDRGISIKALLTKPNSEVRTALSQASKAGAMAEIERLASEPQEVVQ